MNMLSSLRMSIISASESPSMGTRSTTAPWTTPPAMKMKVGYKPGSDDDKTFHDWLHQRYHAPSDDLNQPVDQSAAGKYERVISQLMLTVADDSKRPEWKQESFFRRYSEGKSGK